MDLRNWYILLSIWAFFVLSCVRDPLINPKPRAYPRIQYPEKIYQVFSESTCGFTFQHLKASEIQFSRSFFNEQPTHPCWFDLFYPDFDARIHISYVPLHTVEDYDKCLADVYRIAKQINLRSNFMNDQVFTNPAGIQGVTLDFEGPAASPMHFFVSDQQNHFVKGALYYQTKIDVDSLAPITSFLEKEIGVFLETFEWR